MLTVPTDPALLDNSFIGQCVVPSTANALALSNGLDCKVGSF